MPLLAERSNGMLDFYKHFAPSGAVIEGSTRKPDSTQLGKQLESLIPKQLKITREVFADIVGCTKGLEEYMAEVGHGH